MSSDLLNRNTMPANAETLDNGQADPDGQETDYRTANDRPQATFVGNLVPPRGPVDVVAPTILDILPPDGTFLGLIENSTLVGGGYFPITIRTDEALSNFETVENWLVSRDDGLASLLTVREVVDAGVNSQGERLYEIRLEGEASEGKYKIEVNPAAGYESRVPVSDSAGNPMANTSWEYYADLQRPQISSVQPSTETLLDLNGNFSSRQIEINFSEFIGTGTGVSTLDGETGLFSLVYVLQSGATVEVSALSVTTSDLPFTFGSNEGSTNATVTFSEPSLPSSDDVVRVAMEVDNTQNKIQDRAGNTPQATVLQFSWSALLPDVVLPTWTLDNIPLAACDVPLAVYNGSAALSTTLPPIDVQFSEAVTGATTLSNYTFLGVDDVNGNPAYEVVSIQDLGGNRYRIIGEAVGSADIGADSYTGTMSLSSVGGKILDGAGNALSGTIDWNIVSTFPTNMTVTPASIPSGWNEWDGRLTVNFNQPIMSVGDDDDDEAEIGASLRQLWYLQKIDTDGNPTGSKLYPGQAAEAVVSGEIQRHVLTFNTGSALGDSSLRYGIPEDARLFNGGGFIYAKNSCGQAGMPFSGDANNWQTPAFQFTAQDAVRPYITTLTYYDDPDSPNVSNDLCKVIDGSLAPRIVATVVFNEDVINATNKDNWMFYVSSGTPIHYLNRKDIDSGTPEIEITTVAQIDPRVYRVFANPTGSGDWPNSPNTDDVLFIMPNRADLNAAAQSLGIKTPVQPIEDLNGNLVKGDPYNENRSAESHPKLDDNSITPYLRLEECVTTPPYITNLEMSEAAKRTFCAGASTSLRATWSERPLGDWDDLSSYQVRLVSKLGVWVRIEASELFSSVSGINEDGVFTSTFIFKSMARDTLYSLSYLEDSGLSETMTIYLHGDGHNITNAAGLSAVNPIDDQSVVFKPAMQIVLPYCPRDESAPFINHVYFRSFDYGYNEPYASLSPQELMCGGLMFTVSVSLSERLDDDSSALMNIPGSVELRVKPTLVTTDREPIIVNESDIHQWTYDNDTGELLIGFTASFANQLSDLDEPHEFQFRPQIPDVKDEWGNTWQIPDEDDWEVSSGTRTLEIPRCKLRWSLQVEPKQAPAWCWSGEGWTKFTVRYNDEDVRHVNADGNILANGSDVTEMFDFRIFGTSPHYQAVFSPISGGPNPQYLGTSAPALYYPDEDGNLTFMYRIIYESATSGSDSNTGSYTDVVYRIEKIPELWNGLPDIYYLYQPGVPSLYALQYRQQSVAEKTHLETKDGIFVLNENLGQASSTESYAYMPTLNLDLGTVKCGMTELWTLPDRTKGVVMCTEGNERFDGYIEIDIATGSDTKLRDIPFDTDWIPDDQDAIHLLDTDRDWGREAFFTPEAWTIVPEDTSNGTDAPRILDVLPGKHNGTVVFVIGDNGSAWINNAGYRIYPNSPFMFTYNHFMKAQPHISGTKDVFTIKKDCGDPNYDNAIISVELNIDTESMRPAGHPDGKRQGTLFKQRIRDLGSKDLVLKVVYDPQLMVPPVFNPVQFWSDDGKSPATHSTYSLRRGMFMFSLNNGEDTSHEEFTARIVSGVEYFDEGENGKGWMIILNKEEILGLGSLDWIRFYLIGNSFNYYQYTQNRYWLYDPNTPAETVIEMHMAGS